jgi:hypothetical protein
MQRQEQLMNKIQTDGARYARAMSEMSAAAKSMAGHIAELTEVEMTVGGGGGGFGGGVVGGGGSSISSTHSGGGDSPARSHNGSLSREVGLYYKLNCNRPLA